MFGKNKRDFEGRTSHGREMKDYLAKTLEPFIIAVALVGGIASLIIGGIDFVGYFFKGNSKGRDNYKGR